MIHQVLHQHLALAQAARLHILSKHGVTDVKTDDGLYAVSLLVAHLCTHLRTCQHQYHQCQRQLQDDKLCPPAQLRCIRHQQRQHVSIAETTHAATPAPLSKSHKGKHHRDDCQQVEVYGTFKSHYSLEFSGVKELRS